MDLMSAWIENGHFFCFSKALRMSTRQHWEQHGERLLQVACQKTPEALRQLVEIVHPRNLPDGYGGQSLLSQCVGFLPDLDRLQVLVDAGIDVMHFYENGGALHVLVNRVESRNCSDGFFRKEWSSCVDTALISTKWTAMDKQHWSCCANASPNPSHRAQRQWITLSIMHTSTTCTTPPRSSRP